MATTSLPESKQSSIRMATTSPPESKQNGKRSPVIFILPIIVLALAGWGLKTWLYNRTHVNTDNAQVDGSIVPVLAKVGGFVKSVSVVENQQIKAGDPVVQIDDAEYVARLAQADADLAAAVAIAGGRGTGPIGQATAQIDGAISQREMVAAQVQAAQAAQTKAAADLGRMRELFGKRIVSKQQLDGAQATSDEADANLVAVQRQQGTAGTQIENANANARLAVARLASARAARDNAALQLTYTKIVAPLAGTVSRKQVEIGQLVQPGQPLLTIVADTGVWVTSNFKETQLADLRVGQHADIDVDSYPGCTAKGIVQSVSAATGAKFALLPPDNSTGNFTKVVQRVPVRIQVTSGCGADRPLRPGMSVTVHVATR
jgi:membrane fusion protein (multidrug efflux system)